MSIFFLERISEKAVQLPPPGLFADPFTDKRAVGAVVPMPTFPLPSISNVDKKLEPFHCPRLNASPFAMPEKPPIVPLRAKNLFPSPHSESFFPTRAY